MFTSLAKSLLLGPGVSFEVIISATGSLSILTASSGGVRPCSFSAACTYSNSSHARSAIGKSGGAMSLQ